jgi:hypothetical protein
MSSLVARRVAVRDVAAAPVHPPYELRKETD